MHKSCQWNSTETKIEPYWSRFDWCWLMRRRLSKLLGNYFRVCMMREWSIRRVFPDNRKYKSQTHQRPHLSRLFHMCVRSRMPILVEIGQRLSKLRQRNFMHPSSRTRDWLPTSVLIVRGLYLRQRSLSIFTTELQDTMQVWWHCHERVLLLRPNHDEHHARVHWS